MACGENMFEDKGPSVHLLRVVDMYKCTPVVSSQHLYELKSY